MPNHVRDWMSSPVIVVDPDSSVSHALTLMRRRNIHSLLVDVSSEDKPIYGIITTTDIRDKIIAADRNPANTAVREIMTAPYFNRRSGLDTPRVFQEDAGIPHPPYAGK
jgi:CBS domain-containing protein